MPTSRVFTVKDVCASLGGISRSRVHTWAQLPPFAGRSTRERSARHFTKADLVTMSVLAQLDEQFGVKGDRLAWISAGIHRYLQAPRAGVGEELVFIRLEDGGTRPLHADPLDGAGWVVDLAPARERIDVYLGVAPEQRELALVADAKRSAR